MSVQPPSPWLDTDITAQRAPSAQMAEHENHKVTLSKHIAVNPQDSAASALDSAAEVRQKLDMFLRRHSEAASYYKRLFWFFAVATISMAVTIPMIEGLTTNETSGRRPLVMLVGSVNACLLAIVYMCGFDSLRDRHAETAKLYTSLLHDFDYKVWYPGQRCKESLQTGLEEFLRLCDKVVGALASQVPAVPPHILKKHQEPLPFTASTTVRSLGSNRVSPIQDQDSHPRLLNASSSKFLS